METIFLEDVFPSVGYPTRTFVISTVHRRIYLSLRTPGRSLIVEGASGTGKTSGLIWALRELGGLDLVHWCNGLHPQDHERLSGWLAEVEQEPNLGRTIVVDDFHELSDELKQRVYEAFLRSVSGGREADKWVLCGIARSGQPILPMPSALHGRLDRFSLGRHSTANILQQIQYGEEALQIQVLQKEELALAAAGQPHLASLLLQEACLQSRVLTSCQNRTEISVDVPKIIRRVCEGLAPLYAGVTRQFVRGPKFCRVGRAPYFHLLRLVSETPNGELALEDGVRMFGENQALRRLLDKNLLTEFLLGESGEEFRGLLQFDAHSRTLRIEEPKFHWYLQHLDWDRLGRQAGFLNVRFDKKYDFAISFAGSDREIAEKIFESLDEAEVSVFYDRNEEHTLLGEDLAAYIGPVYREESSFVIVLVSHEYRRREWTMFEYEQYKDRDNVITVWLEDVDDELFEPLKRTGHMKASFYRNQSDLVETASRIFVKKLEESRM